MNLTEIRKKVEQYLNTTLKEGFQNEPLQSLLDAIDKECVRSKGKRVYYINDTHTLFEDINTHVRQKIKIYFAYDKMSWADVVHDYLHHFSIDEKKDVIVEKNRVYDIELVFMNRPLE